LGFFPDTFATVLGFPDLYGRNMNAWIDCPIYRDEDDGMASVHVDEGDVVRLRLMKAKDSRRRVPSRTTRSFKGPPL
jgi:Barstar (barnase inhibitor)